MTNRNQVMDWMRGLAAVWVVFFHLNEPIKYVPNFYTDFCKLGWIGVPAFFVISGWCMAAISQKKPNFKAFIMARLLRIFPPYWASLLVVAVVVVGLVLMNGVNDVTALPKSVWAFLATVSLATSPVTSVPGVNWVYWSLSFEIAFYLLVGLGLLFSGSQQKLDLWMISLLAFSVVISVLKVSPILNFFVFWSREFSLFVLGWFGQRLFSAGASSVFLVSCLSGLIAVAFSPTYGVLKAVVGLSSVLALGIGSKLSCPSSPFLQWLGERSYSIYLIHVPVGCYLLLKLRSTAILDHLPLHLGFDVVAVAVVVIISALFYSFVELPSHRFAMLMAQKI